MFRSVFYIILIMITVCFAACQRFYSIEGRTLSFIAKGALQDSVGNCRKIIINGNFIKDTLLISDNFITVSANITTIGKYTIFTDTINGYWFRDTGTINNTGLQSFTLKGYGIPFSTVAAHFTVHLDSTVCSFTIPPNVAIFTFDSPLGSCPNIKVNGTYWVGATLNTADTISVPVTVLTPGTFSIQTATVNGMSFSAKGIFSITGNYSVALKGEGLPLKKSSNQIPIVISNTTCNFIVNVITDSSMYWKFSAEGNNYFGLLDSVYGALSDTGLFIVNNPNRIFGIEFGGGDGNNNQDSSNFGMVISRLNTPLVAGIYHTYSILGGADFNAYMRFVVNNNYSTNNYFIYSSAYINQFTINLTSFDPVSKLVEGNFSGPVYKLKSINDRSGPVVIITNGEFKTYMTY